MGADWAVVLPWREDPATRQLPDSFRTEGSCGFLSGYCMHRCLNGQAVMTSSNETVPTLRLFHVGAIRWSPASLGSAQCQPRVPG